MVTKEGIRDILTHPRKAMALIGLGPRGFVRLKTVEPMFLGSRPEVMSGYEQLLDPISCELSDIYAHVPTLYMIAVENRCRTILELGTRAGVSTQAFLAAAKETGGHVYSVDVDPCYEAKEKIAQLGLEMYWTFTQANDMKVPWDKPLDLLFIDTLHTYDQATAELAKYGPYVRSGGVVIMHDFQNSGVRKAAEDYALGNPKIRLYRYWNNNGLAVMFHP